MDPAMAPKRAEGGTEGTNFPQNAANASIRTTRPLERKVYKRVAARDEPKLDQHEMKKAMAAVVAELSTMDDIMEKMQKVGIINLVILFGT